MTFVLIGQQLSENYLLRRELTKKGKSLHTLQALFPLRCWPLPARKLFREVHSLGLLPLLFPALRVGRGRGRGLRVHLVLCSGGLPPLPLGLGPARGVGVSLDFSPLRASVLPLLQLLRELAKGELLGRSGLPLPALLPRLSLPIPHRTLDNMGNWETSEDRTRVLSSRGSRSLDREALKDKRARARSGSSCDCGRRSRSLSSSRSRSRGRERRRRSSSRSLYSRVRLRQDRSRSSDHYRSLH